MQWKWKQHEPLARLRANEKGSEIRVLVKIFEQLSKIIRHNFALNF